MKNVSCSSGMFLKAGEIGSLEGQTITTRIDGCWIAILNGSEKQWRQSEQRYGLLCEEQVVRFSWVKIVLLIF